MSISGSCEASRGGKKGWIHSPHTGTLQSRLDLLGFFKESSFQDRQSQPTLYLSVDYTGSFETAGWITECLQRFSVSYAHKPWAGSLSSNSLRFNIICNVKKGRKLAAHIPWHFHILLNHLIYICIYICPSVKSRYSVLWAEEQSVYVYPDSFSAISIRTQLAAKSFRVTLNFNVFYKNICSVKNNLSLGTAKPSAKQSLVNIKWL